MGRRRYRLDRRHLCLHECEARKNAGVVAPLWFYAAEATALQAEMPAVQSRLSPLSLLLPSPFSQTGVVKKKHGLAVSGSSQLRIPRVGFV